MFKKFVEWLNEMWNIYGGIILSTILAWMYGFNVSYMERTTSFIIMALTFCSVFTIIKRSIKSSKGNKLNRNDELISPPNIKKKRSRKNKLDKATLSQPRVKAIDTAVNTEQAVQELSDTIIITTTLVERMVKFIMEKVKNFFKRVWGNKATISNIIVNLIAVGIADYLVLADYLLRFEFVAKNELAFKIVIPILGFVYLALDIFTTVSKYGWENLNELNEKAEQKRIDKENKLPKAQRDILKEARVNTKKFIAETEKKLEAINKAIEQFEVMARFTPADEEQSKKHNANLEEKRKLEVQLETHKITLENIEKTLK